MALKELLGVQESQAALKALIPGIANVPDAMRQDTLRELLASVTHRSKQQIDEIDAILRKV